MPSMVSVVVPVYRNADTLERLHARICASLQPAFADFEVIYVNDGSPDDSARVLDGLVRRDGRARVVELPQNTGQHRAILAGLATIRGDAAVVIDADLQDPPEAIPRLLDRLNEGLDAVFAGRQGGHQSRLRHLTSRVFKRLQAWLTGLPADAGSFVAIRRPIIDRLLAIPPGPQTVVAMIGIAGGRLASIPVERVPRPVGILVLDARVARVDHTPLDRACEAHGPAAIAGAWLCDNPRGAMTPTGVTPCRVEHSSSGRWPCSRARPRWVRDKRAPTG